MKFTNWCSTSVISLFILSGCSGWVPLSSRLDAVFFGLVGGTVFSDPYKVTTKQLHFDTGELFGKDVIFEGFVTEKGELSTYVVVRDEDGRMLVVLSQVDDAYKTLDRGDVNYIRVLGRLERGKKGLPYILAKAIRSSKPSSS